MKKKLLKIIKNHEHKTITIAYIENKLIEYFKTNQIYEDKGGFSKLANEIKSLKELGIIIPIKSSEFYFKKPYVKEKWKILEIEESELWIEKDFFKLSKYFDISYFEKNLSKQTNKNLEYLNRAYDFLESRESRLVSSVEERTLELFDNEKYITEKDNVLSKIKLNEATKFESLEDAFKMKKYTQMFVYYQNKNEKIQNIIIVENQSTFFTYKRLISENQSIFNTNFDVVIWGQGKRIINSFEMIKEITEDKKINIKYFGDMDPEGYFIYLKLKEKYDDYNISLQEIAYIELVEFNKNYSYKTKQLKNEENINKFCSELNNIVEERIRYNFKNNLRIPQELLTYEFFRKRDINGYL